MNCEVCDATMSERRTTPAAPYAYALAGLPHVGLAGIVVYECPRGHSVVPRIPRVGELHRAIAQAFIGKSAPLNGAEIRFLRKNAGFSAQKFAALLAVDPAYLSRVETGRVKALGGSTDRLARAIITAQLKGGEAVTQLLQQEATARLEKKRQRQAQTFQLDKGNHWKQLSLAA
jgi:DNA-binding transcriptional regulator YiaG